MYVIVAPYEDNLKILNEIQKIYNAVSLQESKRSKPMKIIDNPSPKISVIIPAFNAGKYIFKCVNSILNQTFSDFEIIIVNDGSTDDTNLICKELESTDARINYIYKENEGQGKTRNLALKLARAEWIAFIDADDWVNSSYLENLYIQAQITNSDIVVCDYIEYHSENGLEIRQSQELGNTDSILNNVSATFWAKLWKKSYLRDKGIEQPAIFFEDIAIVPYLIATVSKITYSTDSIYYYAVRNNSTARSIQSLDDRAKALNFLLDLFEKNNLFEKKSIELYAYIIKRCQADMIMAKLLLEEKYNQIYDTHNSLLNKYFPLNGNALSKRNVFVWGSYNTYHTAKYINRIEIAHRFMATSIISAVSAPIDKINQKPLKRQIPLREENVIRDCTKRFMHMNPAEFENVEIVLIDFLDERFTIATEDNGFITLSDAYLEDTTAYIPQRLIEIKDRDELWYLACDKFIEQLQNCFPTNQIYLIRMKLAECYGSPNKQKKYNEIGKIHQINDVLDKYYDYFASKCRNVIEIYVHDKRGYYTDSEFRYGCYPWHLNEEVYKSIADDIMKCLETETCDSQGK